MSSIPKYVKFNKGNAKTTAWFAAKEPSDIDDELAYVNGMHLIAWVVDLLQDQQRVSPVTGKYLVEVDISHITEEQRGAFLQWFIEGDQEEKVKWLGRQWYLGSGSNVLLNDGNPANFDDVPKFFQWIFGLQPAQNPTPFSFADGSFSVKMDGGRRKRKGRKTRRRQRMRN